MSEKPIKVGLVNLGCPKNQVDAEMMLDKLANAGFQLETEPGLADVVIINTCGFITSAKEEAIENIDEFLTLKKRAGFKRSSSPAASPSGISTTSPKICPTPTSSLGLAATARL